MHVWDRYLTIKVTSTKFKQQLTFGNNIDNNLNIEVEGTKYMATAKDNMVVKISNLTYKEITQLIYGEFDRIEVWAGYKSSSIINFFSGYITYISNQIEDRKTNTVYFICTALMLGINNNKRLNLTFTSGINMYSAINAICRLNGINNQYVSTDYKREIIQTALSLSGSATSMLDTLLTSHANNSLVSNSDSSEASSTISFWNVSRTNARVMELRRDNINVSGGYPTLNKDGIRITVMPTFNFKPGDVIKLDNSLIDMSLTTLNEVKNTPYVGNYVDANGQYVIFELSYKLQNRGSAFTIELLCKSKSLYSGIVGGASN